MTTSATCGCDDSKAWEARAIRAEADLALAKNLLRETRDRIETLMAVLPTEEPDEMEELVPGTWGETVLASGKAMSGCLLGELLVGESRSRSAAEAQARALEKK